MSQYNLDISSPNRVPNVLLAVADLYRESAAELRAAWGDPSAGAVWNDFAIILEKAAKSCEAALVKRGLSRQ